MGFLSGGHYERDMFRQLQEALSSIDDVKQSIHVLKEEQQQEIARIDRAHQEGIQGLKRIIAQRDVKIGMLEQENGLLREEVGRLKSIINNDSNNSSQPPSADQQGGKRANTHNSRGKSTRAKGAQPGHTGKTLTQADIERHIKEGHYEHQVIEHGERRGTPVVRYEVDMRMTLCATEHRFYPNTKGQYDIPAKYRSGAIYGEQIRALIVFLYNVGAVSNERIWTIVNGISGGKLELSQGSVYKIISKFAASLDVEIETIRNQLLCQEVLYTDGTNITVNGKQQYIRNTSSKYGVLYEPLEKKNLACMRELSVLPYFTGTLVHDHETALYQFGLEHAECNVHLLRYLKKNTEDTGHAWSKALSLFLCGANHERKERMRAGREFTTAEINEFNNEYDRICAKGLDENKDCKPRWAMREEQSLLRRLAKYKQKHLLFLARFDVAFDNNLSERDLRKCKTRQKVSGGFRDHQGAVMYCRILSFIETCKRQAIDLFSAMINVISGGRVIRTGE